VGLHRPEERAHAQSGQQGLRSGHGRLQREHVPDVEPWNDKREGSLAALAPFGQPVAPDQTFHNWAGGARVDLELGNNLTLSYIPGYLYLKSDIRNYWLGALPARQSARIPEVTQELRLSGSSSNLKWLAGLYAYRTVNSGSAVFLYGFPSAFFISNVQRNRLQGAAVFGQATYSFSDALRLTVGGRYGVDDRQGTATSPAGPGLSLPLLKKIPPVRLQDRRGIRCGARHGLCHVPDGVSAGHLQRVPVHPAQQCGGAARHAEGDHRRHQRRLLDNTLQINDEFFYYDYRNLQLQAINVNAILNPIFNAAKVTIPGNQLDILYQPDSDNRINLSVSYVHARNRTS
jgi:iron complex outermembrane receptor protein